jgi:hypothetical protein
MGELCSHVVRSARKKLVEKIRNFEGSIKTLSLLSPRFGLYNIKLL